MLILVSCRGFIGDILFASSLAKKLKEKYPGSHITYQIPLPQPKLLLEQNPYIDKVLVGEVWTGSAMKINIPEVDQRYPATIQMQAAAGIEDQSLEFDVWTVPEYDEWAKVQIYNASKGWNTGAEVFTWQKNWEYKAYQCTPQLYAAKIGAPHREIDRIIEAIEDVGPLIPIGFDRHISQFDPIAADAESYAKAASIIKMSDYFLGSEGGLSNLAAAVGTRCIITTDFIHQVYGPNGHVKQIENPQMGPAVYYPDAGHVHLDPYITDQEIIDYIWNLKPTRDWQTKPWKWS